MFSKWPPRSRPEEIRDLVRTLADGFIEQAKGSLTLISEKYEIEEFSGRQCKGSFVTFAFEIGDTHSVQAMFMMSIDGQIWNGQFTGTTEQWTEALDLLTSIKRNG